MPKERIRHSGQGDFADLMVCWSKEDRGCAANGVEAPKVDVLIAAPDLPGHEGSYMFTPEHADTFGMADGESVGPVSVSLDRGQINRLIRVLRQARDTAYGPDA